MNKGQKALRRAVAAAGSQTKLAAAIGVRQSHIHYWLHKTGVPPERAADVERVTGIPRWELRPDVFAAAEKDVRTKRGAEGHFSRHKHIRRDHFKTGADIEEYIRTMREEWSHR